MYAHSSNIRTNLEDCPLTEIRGDEVIQGWGFAQSIVQGKMQRYSLRSALDPLLELTYEKDSCLLTSPETPLFLGTFHGRLWYDLLLLERQGCGAALAVVVNFFSGFAGEPVHYRRNASGGIARERFWLVKRCPDKQNASYLLHLLSCRFGLPIAELQSGWPGIARPELERVFHEVDTLARVKDLKSEYGLHNSDVTVFLLDDVARSRRIRVDLVLFGSKDAHLVQIRPLADVSVSRNGTILPPSGDELAFPSVPEAVTYIQETVLGHHVDLIVRARLDNRDYRVLHASHAHPGMFLPILSKRGQLRQSQILSSHNTEQKGDLCSFAAPPLETVVINGIVMPMGQQLFELIGSA